MGLFRKTKPKTKEEKLEEYKNGIGCKYVIGEIIGNDYGDGTRMAATATFGLIGLAATSGMGLRERIVRGKIRLAEKGVVLYSYGISDIRIPYSEIVGIERPPMDVCSIILSSGEKIKVAPFDVGIFDVIEERACGQDEEGW